MSGNNLIPFIILFLSIVIIYGILTKKKNDRIKSHIENFSNINKGVISNAANNTPFTKELANGIWTCSETVVDKDYNVKNLMEIDINSTTIDYTNPEKILGTINLNGLIYNINYFLNGTLKASYTSYPFMYLYIQFLNDFTKEDKLKENSPFYITNTPRCMVSFYFGDLLFSKTMSYKVYDNKVGAELYRIILAKDFFVLKPPQMYNFDVYKKIVGNYNYPLNYIHLGGERIHYNKGNVADRNAYNTINNKYHGRLKFAIQRVFQSPTNNEIITKISNPILIENITNNNSLPEKINIGSFKNDKLANNLKDFFIPKATILYFYKLVETNISYDFANKSLINIPSSLAKLQNNANNMFKSNIEFNDIKSVEKVFNNKFHLIAVKRLNSDLENNTVVSFSDLYRLL